MTNTPTSAHPPLGEVTVCDHVGISVADIDACVQWYCEKLGAVITREYSHPEWDVRVAWVAVGGFSFELIERKDSDPYPTPGESSEVVKTQGYAHICFRVDDCERVSADLEGRGVEFSWGVRDWPELGLRTSNAMDPEGNLIEILEERS